MVFPYKINPVVNLFLYEIGTTYSSINEFLVIDITYLINCIYQYKFSASILMGANIIFKLSDEEG